MEAYYAFGRAYNALAAEALADKKQLWGLVPKLRQSEHLFVDWPQRGINIRFTACLLDEDFIGKIKKICEHTHPRSMSVRVAQHWAALVALKWAGVEELLRR